MARGGARPGAGRKKKEPIALGTWKGPTLKNPDAARPLDFWLAILRDPQAPMDLRMWASEQAGPVVHARLAPKSDAQGSLADLPGAGDDWSADLNPDVDVRRSH
ncbi:hypothetical protein LWC05_05490 [Acetobacter sicerae]|uniref:Uncharacterized protein n=1 Tax=Acetobacter sicerae TaxID=85325 RepID=A0ABS8VW85_9PROT|nr:hypothetical protein [Acetobacter sicerae]MCE0743344.1 hypothetical protein [Acetobacter sicerae]